MVTKTKTLKIGIASVAQMRARTLAIAGGKLKPAPDDPKVWFLSVESVAKVLSEKNQELLRIICEAAPDTLNSLAEKTGRHKSNLSRTLKTLDRYGLVHIQRGERGRIKASVPYRRIDLSIAV